METENEWKGLSIFLGIVVIILLLLLLFPSSSNNTIPYGEGPGQAQSDMYQDMYNASRR